MKNILLPTDFSPNAQNAIEYALSLFRDRECNFFIMNAFQVGTSGLMTTRSKINNTRLFQLLKEESKHELKNILKTLQETNTNPNHRFTTLCVANHLPGAIRKIVHSKKIDCIVIGTKNARNFKTIWGNHTYKTLKAVQACPIVVPESCKNRSAIRTIVLATGYEHLFEAHELKPLLQLAQLFDAEVQITYVGNLHELTPAQKRAKAIVQGQLEHVKHRCVAIEKVASVSSTLQKMIEDNPHIDMVAMLDHWHSFPEKLTHETVLKRFFLSTQVPLLVMQRSKQEHTLFRGGLTRFVRQPLRQSKNTVRPLEYKA